MRFENELKNTKRTLNLAPIITHDILNKRTTLIRVQEQHNKTFQLMKYLPLIFSFLYLTSCNSPVKIKNESTKAVTLIKYAKGIDIVEFEDYYKLTISSPYKEAKNGYKYILAKKTFDETGIDELTQIIHIPVKKMIATSTTHIPMIELFHEEKSIVGFPSTEFISSKKTRALVDNGSIKELGIDADLNIETVLDLSPDVVVGYAVSSTNKSLETIKRSGIPVIYNGAWLEETPIGRAEWLKLFGLLYDKSEMADSLFLSIKNEYEQVKSIAAKATTTSTVLSGSMFKDVWNLPAGESFVAQFLKDANTDYLWKHTKGKGSLQLNFESVLDKGQYAELWIAPGYFTSKEQLINSNEHYKNFDAFNNDNIYTFANKKGATGGVVYYELAPVRPDLVLKDIIKIAHPSLLPDYEFTFFEKMK